MYGYVETRLPQHMTKNDLVDAMDNVPDYAEVGFNDGMFIARWEISGWEPKND